ncbi:hypothetical protein B0H17DRAFT_1110686 [Mycena rosella]|uniref:GmrSD restriction endonucleases N-terminal domain-containing protein n=1 Tax=Mycena rosella TaxID=1033263 RepID=A0AAD7FLD4_MYCRO|nr:hypothetical protein B0H17DRAFT_1110686 [Mycena rosella]
MTEDEYSDLTDLDELSDDNGKGKGKAKPGEGYRIRHALKAPRATTYSTEALYKQIHNGDIDLEPEYQREVVWPEAKQIGIIDSIFRNFYIPPVIFAVNALDDGTETRTCIDGKQRLTSIHRFVQGLIPRTLTNEKLWYRDNPAHRTKTAKKILPEKYRKLFDGKAVVCVEYQDLEDADEREIFQRVQLGVALTPAEKLKVLTTPRARFVRTLQDTFLNSESAGLGGAALAWDRSRGSDFRCLAQTIQCIALSPKTTSIQATEKWLADPAPMVPAFASSIEGTYRVFERLVQLHPASFTKIAPVEFIAVGILVHRHKHKLTLAGLAGAVTALRADVRKVHDDIRNNGKVYKTICAFIDAYRGPAVGRAETCAADAVGEGATGVASGSTAGTKRKAAAASDDENADSDDDYAPARRVPLPPKKRASPAKPAAPPTPPMSAPPPGSPPTAAQPSGIDVLREAKERIAAMKLAQAHVAPAPQAQAQAQYSFNPNASFGYQQAGYQQQSGYGLPQTQQQHGAGRGGRRGGARVALDECGERVGATPNGTRVKTEPGASPFRGGGGAPPYSAGSSNGGGGGPPPFSAGSSGSYGSGRGRSGYHDERDHDRERDRERDRDRDRDYRERGDYDSARYRERDGGRGGRGWR